MVQNTRAPEGTGGIRPLGLPQPVEVRSDQRGWPLTVKLNHRWVPVTVEDRWRIDDEWWREEGVERIYFEALFPNGSRCVLFCDLSPVIASPLPLSLRAGAYAEAWQSPPHAEIASSCLLAMTPDKTVQHRWYRQ